VYITPVCSEEEGLYRLGPTNIDLHPMGIPYTLQICLKFEEDRILLHLKYRLRKLNDFCCILHLYIHVALLIRMPNLRGYCG